MIYQFNCMVVAFRTMLSAACEVMSLRLFNKNNINKNYQGALPLLYYKPTETRETFCIIIKTFVHLCIHFSLLLYLDHIVVSNMNTDVIC